MTSLESSKYNCTSQQRNILNLGCVEKSFQLEQIIADQMTASAIVEPQVTETNAEDGATIK